MSWNLDKAGVLHWSGWQELTWLVHGFSTRLAGDFQRPAPADTPERFGAPDFELCTLKQMHSDIVRAAFAATADAEGDGLVTDQPKELLGVRTADCLPLLLLDRQNRAVAAVHAGWRGAAAGIASLAIDRMADDFGTKPNQIEALIGPCISSDHYEVGLEVAEQFPPDVILEIQNKPRPFLDLVAANRMQLQDAGVPGRAIHVASLCTYTREDWFYSYRRSADAERMLAVIGLRDNG
jgi:YfiH family protein